jgi:hypothetical protein
MTLEVRCLRMAVIDPIKILQRSSPPASYGCRRGQVQAMSVRYQRIFLLKVCLCEPPCSDPRVILLSFAVHSERRKRRPV